MGVSYASSLEKIKIPKPSEPREKDEWPQPTLNVGDINYSTFKSPTAWRDTCIPPSLFVPSFFSSFLSFFSILSFPFSSFPTKASAMQVEYESSPAVEQPSFEEGVSFRPGSSTQAGGAESEEEQDEEDVEAGQGTCHRHLHLHLMRYILWF